MVRFPWMVQDSPAVIAPGISLLHLTTGTTVVRQTGRGQRLYQKLCPSHSSAPQNKPKKNPVG